MSITQLICSSLLLLLALALTSAQTGESYDLIIRRGTLYDGNQYTDIHTNKYANNTNQYTNRYSN